MHAYIIDSQEAWTKLCCNKLLFILPTYNLLLQMINLPLKEATSGEKVKQPLRLTWREEEVSPQQFTSFTGTAVAHGNTAYFSHNHAVYSISQPDFRWTLLTEMKCRLFGMAIIKDNLTTIGGCTDESSSCTVTNVLTSFVSSVLFGKSWKEVFPPMPTKRKQPAAIAANSHLIVAGGWNQEGHSTSKVEVLNLDTRQWSSASCLPELPYHHHMTSFRGQLYVSIHSCVLTCNLEKLIKSSNLKSSSEDSKVWATLSKSSDYYSASLIVLGEHLLALGGTDNLSIAPKSSVYCYDQRDNHWNEIEPNPFPRCRFLTAVLQNNKVIAVGGKNEHGDKTNDTYIGTLVE